ncbi:hypothetical protein D3C71_1865220 [compost metagenome]
MTAIDQLKLFIGWPHVALQSGWLHDGRPYRWLGKEFGQRLIRRQGLRSSGLMLLAPAASKPGKRQQCHQR